MPIVRTLLLAVLLYSVVLSSPGYSFTFQKQQDSAARSVYSSRFIFSPDIKLLEIDGEEYDNKFLNSGDTVLSLEPGYHEFRLRYEKIWDLDYDDFDPLQSEAEKISVAAESGSTHRIDHKPLSTYKEAKQFTFEPELFVVDTRNQKRVSPHQSEELMTSRVTQIQSYAGNGDSAQVIAADSALVSSSVATTGTADAIETSRAAHPVSQPQSLTMLQYWWKRTSVKDRRQFYQWIETTVQH